MQHLGYCESHTKANYRRQYDQRRASGVADDAWYRSTPWRKVSALQRKEEPLCRECLRVGVLTPATLVDHIVPIKDGGARLDSANLQSLCDACHSRKSASEGSRWGERALVPTP